MSNVVSWKRIGLFAAALLFAEVLAGFLTGGLEAAESRLAASVVLSFCFSALLFAFMAAGQHKPFLHSSLSLLLTFVFSLALGAILPAWLTEKSLVLAALDWLVLVLGLVVGTSTGRFVGLRRARADA